ncbi:MAG TPA: aminotransferase class III-fold pyridoxal phosphate-dependent enzyme [Roseiarcus sp.]|nr:aminotransferase class III-fold pyridoxal phosphate-dependent enzyme [Roseiarcus sp.]
MRHAVQLPQSIQRERSRKLAALCLNAIEDEIKFRGAGHHRRLHRRTRAGRRRRRRVPKGFYAALKKPLNVYDIPLIADKVVAAFGRIGAWFGCRLDGVKPDFMCIAKAITSGYFPFSAVVMNEKIESAFRANEDALGAIYHGYTYSRHRVGWASALGCLDETFAQDLPGNAKAGRLSVRRFPPTRCQI